MYIVHIMIYDYHHKLSGVQFKNYLTESVVKIFLPS